MLRKLEVILSNTRAGVFIDSMILNSHHDYGDLGNQASPASHRKHTSNFYEEMRSDISETGPTNPL